MKIFEIFKKYLHFLEDQCFGDGDRDIEAIKT